jgi:hypothetical protein
VNVHIGRRRVRVARNEKRGLVGILLGSPFALLGLIFLLGGKVGVGLPFLLLGLAPAVLGAATGRHAASPADDPDPCPLRPRTASPPARIEGIRRSHPTSCKPEK